MKLDRLHITLGILLALGVAFRAVHSRSPGQQGAHQPAALTRQIGEVTAKRTKDRPGRKPKPPAAAPTAADPPTNLRRETTPAGAVHPGARRSAPSTTPGLLVNLDLAPAASIESLPRIGPALAKRIVEDRSAHGPFGSLAALDRVKGVGPGLQKHIAPYVTFSPSGRPSTVASIPRRANPAARGKTRQRPPGSAVP